MCEATNPEEKNNNNGNDNVPTDEEEEGLEVEDDDEDLTAAEVVALNHELDVLNLALDEMESKRDSIHSQLLELLKSNRDVRKEIREENEISESIKNMDLDSNSKPTE